MATRRRDRRTHRLFPGDSEILLLADETDLVLAAHVIAAGSGWEMRVRIWDADTGQLASEFVLNSAGKVTGSFDLKIIAT
jgi:hypothetical protein